MPVDPEYIEQLVLEEIAGVISAEDSVKLLELITEYPEARAIWEELHAQLPEGYVESIREKLAKEMPMETIIARVRERKVKRLKKRIMYGLAVMVVGTAIIVGIHQQMPPKAVIKPALPGVDDDEVVTRILKVEGQPVINLDAVKDSVNIKDAIIYIYGDTLSLKGGTEDMVAMLMTPYGVESYIELADKTVGWVAPGTAIQFQLSNNNTERELAVNGEVFLSIAKDADRPFIVQVPNGTINVLGTSFGVNTIENDSVVVSLTEGKVRMITAADALTLHPGEAVHLTQNQPLNPVPFDSAGLLRRQQGVYTFQDATLSDIADVIYRVRHIFSTVMPQVIDKRYSGEINMRAPVKKILADVKRTVPGFDYEVAIHSRGDTLLRFFGK